MKTLRNTLIVAASLLISATGAVAQVTHPNQIKTPSLRNVSMPQPKRIQLPNGMVIFLQEDHELPLVRGSALIRGGSRDVPSDKAGLMGIYSAAWRTGGTASKTGDELDQFLEARAARVETSGGVDSTSVSLDVLKGDFDTVFPIWLDVLRNPAFREDKIQLAKTQANTGISRRNDEPGGILGRELGKLGYGVNSPYAAQAEYASIASITRDDLVAFHKRFVHPNNIIVSFIGDFNSAQVEKKLRDTFSSWAKGPQAPKPPVDVTPAKPGIYFVAKDDVTQSNIGLVHPGVQRNSPDYYALVVMNEIFSGGFSGRLMQRLRSERGLTYGVGGGVGANWDYPGLFRVQMATKSGTTLESIEALRGEITRLINDPVTDAELSLAKESILNAYVFTRDTRRKALDQQVLLEFYGFPKDYFDKYPQNIAAVTAGDVRNAAKKHVHPDQLALLVVGNEKEFEKPLSSLGTVTAVDITIPEPGATPKAPGSAAAAPAAPATSNPEGIALVTKVAEFVGGTARIGAVSALQRSGSMKMVTPQGEMDAQMVSLVQYPNSQRMVMSLPMGEITRVVAPGGAFMITPMGAQDMPSSQRDQELATMKADILAILRNVGNPKYVFIAGGSEKIGDVEARVVDINADGASTRWFIDAASGRLLRTSSRASGPQGPGEVVTEYQEWKSFGGLNLPIVTVVSRNGERAAEIHLANVEVNPTVAADAFAKPAAK